MHIYRVYVENPTWGFQCLGLCEILSERLLLLLLFVTLFFNIYVQT